MKILVVGSGGREHALCWSIAASPLCDKLFCAPGNAGIAAEAECVAIGPEDVPALVDFARNEGIDFVVVGPNAGSKETRARELGRPILSENEFEALLAGGPEAVAGEA